MVVSACHRIGILKRRVIILVLASDCDFWYQSSNNVLYCWVSHGARQSDGVKGGAFCAALDTSASSTDTLLGACLQIMIVTTIILHHGFRVQGQFMQECKDYLQTPTRMILGVLVLWLCMG